MGQGLEWWTAAQINRWERARRSVAWKSFKRDSGQTQVVLETRVCLEGAIILWLMPRPAFPRPDSLELAVEEIPDGLLNR